MKMLQQLLAKNHNFIYTLGSSNVGDKLKDMGSNFCRLYGTINDPHLLIYERINGISLKDYLKKNTISTELLVNIIYQVYLSLLEASKHCFKHQNLNCKNIILTTIEKRTLEYKYDGQDYSIVTNVLAVIIDYSKATVETSNTHNVSADIYRLLMSILAIILSSWKKCDHKNRSILTELLIFLIKPQLSNSFILMLADYKIAAPVITESLKDHLKYFKYAQVPPMDEKTFLLKLKRSQDVVAVKNLNTYIENKYSYQSLYESSKLKSHLTEEETKKLYKHTNKELAQISMAIIVYSKLLNQVDQSVQGCIELIVFNLQLLTNIKRLINFMYWLEYSKDSDNEYNLYINIRESIKSYSKLLSKRNEIEKSYNRLKTYKISELSFEFTKFINTDLEDIFNILITKERY